MSNSNMDYCSFLDVIHLALQRVKDNVQWCEDLDGASARLEMILQSLIWVQPCFVGSTSFTTLISAVSDMVDNVNSAVLEQNLLRCPGRPRLNICYQTCLS